MTSGWSLHPVTQFTHFAARWDALNAKTTQSLLLDSRFISPLLEAFVANNALIALYGDTESPSAMAIVEKTSTGRWSTVQPSQAPLGCWIQQPELNIVTLADTLRKTLPGFNLLMSITQQDPALLPEPTTEGRLQCVPYIETARITITGTFDEYWENRGKNLRQNLRKQRNRLPREGITTKFIKITQAEAMRDAVDAYGQLESAGWKSDLNTAVNINNAQGKFYQAILENFAKTQQALVYQYWYNDTLVATDLCILDAQNIIILKTTYDESIRISSPAFLMRQEAFEELFEQKNVERIEFYGKVMEWHTKWSDEIRRMYHINVFSGIGALLKTLKS